MCFPSEKSRSKGFKGDRSETVDQFADLGTDKGVKLGINDAVVLIAKERNVP
jgi:hypothetical protein